MNTEYKKLLAIKAALMCAVHTKKSIDRIAEDLILKLKSTESQPAYTDADLEARWILVAKDLPPVNTVVNGFNKIWIDEDFNPEGIRECFLHDNEKIWFSAGWNNDCEEWITVESAPTHWMQRPLSPLTSKA